MKKLTLLLIAFIVANTTILSAQTTEAFFNDANTFFNTHVSNGKVAYKAIASNPESLNALITQAEGIRVSENNPAEFQSFWINAYNLAVIKGIVDNYPIKSPLDKKGFFDKITYQLAGQKITLNDIENKMLRAKFNDARFHFVLVCAGLGCPPIINSAYTPGTLEGQLQKQTEIALNNPNFIKVKGNKVQLSQIFEWYKGDFTQNGSEIDYINKYRKEKISANAKIAYYTYDWSLNAK